MYEMKIPAWWHGDLRQPLRNYCLAAISAGCYLLRHNAEHRQFTAEVIKKISLNPHRLRQVVSQLPFLLSAKPWRLSGWVPKGKIPLWCEEQQRRRGGRAGHSAGAGRGCRAPSASLLPCRTRDGSRWDAGSWARPSSGQQPELNSHFFPGEQREPQGAGSVSRRRMRRALRRILGSSIRCSQGAGRASCRAKVLMWQCHRAPARATGAVVVQCNFLTAPAVPSPVWKGHRLPAEVPQLCQSGRIRLSRQAPPGRSASASWWPDRSWHLGSPVRAAGEPMREGGMVWGAAAPREVLSWKELSSFF